MPGNIPPLLGLALWNLLLTHGWTGKELAAATGYSKSTISGYLNGDLPLDREKLEALATAMGIGPVKVEKAVNAARLVHAETPVPVSPVDPTEEEWRILDGAWPSVWARSRTCSARKACARCGRSTSAGTGSRRKSWSGI